MENNPLNTGPAAEATPRIDLDSSEIMNALQQGEIYRQKTMTSSQDIVEGPHRFRLIKNPTGKRVEVSSPYTKASYIEAEDYLAAPIGDDGKLVGEARPISAQSIDTIFVRGE